MEKQRIVINDDLMEKSDQLHDALEELYLGEKQTYQVYLQKKHLNKLEGIFDRIIEKYGWRQVEFEYYLRQSLSAGGSGVWTSFQTGG